MNRLQLTKFSTDFPTSKSDAVSVVGFFLDISFYSNLIATTKPI